MWIRSVGSGLLHRHRDISISWNPGAMESCRDAVRDPESSGCFTGDVGRVQNEKVGLRRCDVGRERNDIALVLGRVRAG